MAIRKKGRSLAEARRAIDAKYRGVSTPTPFPKE
jgi:hypothetical protein